MKEELDKTALVNIFNLITKERDECIDFSKRYDDLTSLSNKFYHESKVYDYIIEKLKEALR